MRRRHDIEISDIRRSTNTDLAVEDRLGLILEVLLDIRDLLSDK